MYCDEIVGPLSHEFAFMVVSAYKDKSYIQEIAINLDCSTVSILVNFYSFEKYVFPQIYTI